METKPHVMRHRLPLVLRLAIGIALILLGIAGLALPIMPGWIFIAMGVVVLGPRTSLGKWIRKWGYLIRWKIRRRFHRKGRAD